MTKNKWALLLVAATMLSAIGSAFAIMPLQVTYTDSFGTESPISANWGTNTGLFPAVTLNIKQFDPSLGTLQSIHLDLHAAASGTLKFESHDSIPETIVGNIGATVNIGRPTDHTSFMADLVVAKTSDLVTKFDGITDFAGGSGRTYSDLSQGSDSIKNLAAGSPDFGMFIGSGVIALPTGATGSSSVTGSSNLSSSLRTFAEADLSVTYTYQPIAGSIPEPGSIGLLLVGLLAFRRVRQIARQAEMSG